MLKNLAYAVVVIVGVYIILQIPFVKNYADSIRNDVIEKRDNVTQEYDRVKGKVDEVTGKVIETKEKVEDTVDAVSDTVDKIGDAADSIGNLVGAGDDEEEATEEPAEGTCTDEEKAAEICTMDYTPVCGDDGVTYGNKCGACASGNIDTYLMGECVAE
ncbi:hypothetical protein JW758_06150 [Candidatus Peregrinibacteria bacterium]|nr:hypothetical protein [Candidatus Peregrinibacteria bacterium]